MKRSCQGRISQKGIHVCEDGIQLRQHLLYHRHQFGSLSHHSGVHIARNNITWFYSLARIVGKQKVHLEIAHDVFLYLSLAPRRNSQILIDIGLHLDRTITRIVEIHLVYRSHLVTIGIDRSRGTQTLYVIKRHVIGVVGGKQVDAFQKIDSEIHHQDTNNSD